ncbi:hypothetical protein F5Y16DRAFT_355117 [Xylariaceae sp. FL0255]|nr:hypothetical protein F5Y16DRAFT_355117 [Xylariaceae sp. FL0255]
MAYSPQQASDELAALLARNLTFQQPAPQPVPEPEPITYSISQHYHHSAHIALQDEPIAEPQRPASEPPQSEFPLAEHVLIQHGVDPTGLSAQQFELFKTADTPQQLRLIELWRICPPTNPQNHPTVESTNTSIQQEELLAQLRYEQQIAENNSQRNSMVSMDGTPLTPIQTSEGHWVHVEPYMMSGYELLARREYEESAKRQLEEELLRSKNEVYRSATDPVYATGWMAQQQAMEDQYGAYQQMEL